jgi:penicillin amidase
MAGDPHRGFDTPNVYYQNHLACPDFDVVGVSFPGAPGFPHFGHNPSVCWGVTHTGADYQDLFVERFKEGDPSQYLFQDQWRRAEIHHEEIKVRGSQAVFLDVTVTHHGPIIVGKPSKGAAIAFRYTQTVEPNTSAEALLHMMKARSTQDLDRSMGQWVDPVNNFVFADIHGNIGYLTRGRVPLRPRANGWLPVPGWTGEHDWQGYIPFQEMPRSHNPEEGYIVTANQKPVSDDYPFYIGLDHAPEFRAQRITNRLKALDKATVDDMASVHADRVSIPAQHLITAIAKVEPSTPLSQKAKDILLAWDGDMDRGSAAAAIYSAFRLHLDRGILEHLLGPLAGEALKATGRGGPAHVTRLRAHFISLLDKGDTSLLPPGSNWPSLMAQALDKAVTELKSRLGEDMSAWEWGKVHHTAPRHPLSLAFPEAAELLDPPSVGMGGDGDTPQSTSYSPGEPYTIASTSVLRYAYDLSDWGNSRWVVPLGSSGHPGSPHYADQVPIWSEVQLIPMLYDWQRIKAEAESHQKLNSL